MTAVINFTPLNGVDEEDPLCYLLTVDDFTFLLDCGWDTRFREQDLENLSRVVQDVDAVLLSHPDIQHIGGLPYAVSKLGLDAPVFCTDPVFTMGKLLLQNVCTTLKDFGFDKFTLADVDTAFTESSRKGEKVTRLKYSEPFSLDGRGEGIQITAYNAGRTLGGTVWRISKETEEVLYAVDFHHRGEKVMAGALIEVILEEVRPSVMITDARTALRGDAKKLSEARVDMMKCIVPTLREKGGDVLIPCDVGGRVLEVLFLLNHAWKKYSTYPLVFLCPQGPQAITAAQGLVQWMTAACQKKLNTGTNPFFLEHVRYVSNLADLSLIPKPRVIIASNDVLTSSMSQDVFLDMIANDPRSMLLMTSQPPSYSLCSSIIDSKTNAESLQFDRQRLVALSGKELEQHREQKLLEENQKLLEESKRMEEDSETEGDSDDETFGVGFKRRRIRMEQQYPMFPCVERRVVVDVWGEAINPNDYVVKEQFDEDDTDNNNTSSSNMEIADRSEAQNQEEDVPKKVVLESMNVNVACDVEVVDLEGRCDLASLKKVLRKVNPKRVILVGGSHTGKQALVDFCNKSLAGQGQGIEVRVPELNQTVDITSETNIYRVNLRDDLMSSARFVNVGEYEVAYIDAAVNIDYKVSQLPMLATPTSESVTASHATVYLGNPGLADVKKLLNKGGVEADFCGGILVCSGGMINIRKNVGKKALSIQGCLSEDYFKIRNLLYGLYQIV